MATTSAAAATTRARKTSKRAPATSKKRHDAEIRDNFYAIEAMMPDLVRSHLGQEALMRHGKIVRFFPTVGEAYDYAMKVYPDHMFSIQPIPSPEITVIHGMPR